jgi:undecaprenyl-diphosphatase
VNRVALPAASGRPLLAVTAGALAVFAADGAVVGTRSHFPGEAATVRDVHTTLSSGLMDALMKSASFVGGPIVVLAVSLVGGLLLAYRARRREALFLLLAVAGAYLLEELGKRAFHRTRPDFYPSLAHARGYSFPSGHATGSLALACALLLLLWNKPRRGLLAVAAAALVFVVGLSRLYLGVHYPSDVVAGWCVALAWVSVVALVAPPPTIASPGGR